jgi:sugar phosphate isomerase/epimerase
MERPIDEKFDRVIIMPYTSRTHATTSTRTAQDEEPDMPNGQRTIPLSLHQLTVTDVDSEQFVDIAAELGCDHVCLFLDMPDAQSPYPCVKSVDQARGLKQRLADNGMSVFNTDTFLVTPKTDFRRYEGMLEIAATLGAQVVDIVSVHPDPEAAAAIIDDFVKMAKGYGLRSVIEAIRFTRIKNLDDALHIIALCDNPDLALNVDIMHLMRSGRRPADLAAKAAPSLRYYAQISDGPIDMPDERQEWEANGDRMVPGTGEFPLVEFVRMLPPDGVVAVEAPLTRLKDSVPSLERARMVVKGARSVLAKAAMEDAAC